MLQIVGLSVGLLKHTNCLKHLQDISTFSNIVLLCCWILDIAKIQITAEIKYYSLQGIKQSDPGAVTF